MTRIALLRFDSGRHDAAAFERDRRRFLEPLRREFELVPARPGGKNEADLEVAFIASGGSEREFRRRYAVLSKPVILLADGRHNSLPAALEIASWVRQRGGRAEIVHGGSRFVLSRLRRLARFHETLRALAGRIGVIGRPSDWLIGSGIARRAARQRWGTAFVDIGLDEVANSAAPGPKAGEIARRFIAGARGLDAVDGKAVRSAARLAPALAAVFARRRLQAATLRCFSLIDSLGTSGCLALSLLNDGGMICGCEGDVPAAFSMLLVSTLTGEAPFLANPAAVDVEKNRVVMAHCTVPRRAVTGYRLQTHFETGRGVALCGAFPAGPATVFKVGGADLGSYFVSAADALPSRPAPGLCRTQVRLRLRETVAYFLRASLANHHVLIREDHAGLIDDFMQYCGARKLPSRES